MKITFSKSFDKHFSKLTNKQQIKVDEVITLFRNDPYNLQLNNHPLHGKLKGFRAISAGGDMRLIFDVEGNYDRVKFYLVGTHNQVY